MADVVILLSGGWGSDGWGESAFGQQVIPALPSAITASVDSVTATGTSNVPATGLESTGGVGSVEVTGISYVNVTGVEGTGEVNSLRFDALVSYQGWGRGSWGESAWSQNATLDALQSGVGTVNVITNVDIDVTGLEATSAVGDVTVVEGSGVTVELVGLEATPAVNDVEVEAGATVPTTGLAATTAVGQVTNRTSQVLPVSAPTPAVGEVNDAEVVVIGDANVYVTGLSSSAEVGNVLVWGRIIPDSNTVWTEIAA